MNISDFHQIFMIYYRDNYNSFSCCYYLCMLFNKPYSAFLNIVSFCRFGILVQLVRPSGFLPFEFLKEKYQLFCYLPYMKIKLLMQLP